MRDLARVFQDSGGRDLGALFWRYLGRPLAMIAGAILVAIIIVHGESWAIQQAPLLLSASDGCLPSDSADDGALPVAVLH